MKKALITAASLLVSVVAFAENVWTVSDGDIVLGQWNSNFTAGKAYAEANNIPMVIFWGNEGCGYCGLLRKAMIKDDFIAWSAKRQLVMIAVEGKGKGVDGDSDYECWKFVKNQSGLFPYCCIYWPKAGGDSVEVRFTGRSNKIPVQLGTLGEKFMSYVDEKTNGYVPGYQPPVPVPPVTPDPPAPVPPVTPDPPTPPAQDEVFNGNIKPTAVLLDAKQNVAGIMTLKCLKPTKRGTSTVSGSIQLMSGLKKAVRSTRVPVGANVTADLKVTTLGTMTLTFTRTAVSGKLGGYTVVSLPVGGPLASKYNFESEFDSTFSPLKGYTPVMSLMPRDRVITTDGSKFNFGEYLIVKAKKVDGKWIYVNADCVDPNRFKLKYKSDTGVITGSMYFYSEKINARTGKPMLKRSIAKVYGAVVEGEGSLLVYLKKTLIGTATLTK